MLFLLYCYNASISNEISCLKIQMKGNECERQLKLLLWSVHTQRGASLAENEDGATTSPAIIF